jgi:hypothetical protein
MHGNAYTRNMYETPTLQRRRPRHSLQILHPGLIGFLALTTLMEQARREDLLVDTMDKSAFDIAHEIVARTGWIAR